MIIFARLARYGRHPGCWWRLRAELSARTIGEAGDWRGGVGEAIRGLLDEENGSFQASLWGLGTAHCHPSPPSPDPPVHIIMRIAKGLRSAFAILSKNDCR